MYAIFSLVVLVISNFNSNFPATDAIILRDHHLQLACHLAINGQVSPEEVVDLMVDEFVDETVDIYQSFQDAQEMRIFFSSLLNRGQPSSPEVMPEEEVAEGVVEKPPNMSTMISSVIDGITNLASLASIFSLPSHLPLRNMTRMSPGGDLIECMSGLPFFSWIAAEKEVMTMLQSIRLGPNRANNECLKRFTLTKRDKQKTLSRIIRESCKTMKFPRPIDSRNAHHIRNLKLDLAIFRQNLVIKYLVDQESQNARAESIASKACPQYQSQKRRGLFVRKEDFERACRTYERSHDVDSALEFITRRLPEQAPERHSQRNQFLRLMVDLLFKDYYEIKGITFQSSNPRTGLLEIPPVNCATDEEEVSPYGEPQSGVRDQLLSQELSDELASVCREIDFPLRLNIDDPFQVRKFFLKAAIERNTVVKDFLTQERSRRLKQRDDHPDSE